MNIEKLESDLNHVDLDIRYTAGLGFDEKYQCQHFDFCYLKKHFD